MDFFECLKLAEENLGTDKAEGMVEDTYERAVVLTNNSLFEAKEHVPEILKDYETDRMFYHIAIRFIKFWGSEAEEWRIDLRNKETAYLSKILVGMPLFRELESGYLEEEKTEKDTGQKGEVWFANELVELMKTNMHRTLIQTFATLVFAYLAQDDFTNKVMSEKINNCWYNLTPV